MNVGRSAMLFATGAVLAAAVVSGQITWHELPPLPVGLAGGASALVGGGKILYAGGTTWIDGVKQWLRDVRVYDPGGKSWNSGPGLPEPLAYGGRIATAGRLEILGGLNQNGPSRNCWRLDYDLGRWSKSGLLPQDGVLSRVERVGSADYLFGGCSDAAVPMHCSSIVWKRDAGGKWIRAGEMPDGAIALRASVVMDGRVYLFGGCSEGQGGVVNRDNAYGYNPATAQWRKLSPLPVAVRGMSAASVRSGHILLAGGYQESGFTDDVWIYDAGLDRYQRATPLPFPASGIDLIANDGVILALGGEDRMRSRSRRFIQGTMK